MTEIQTGTVARYCKPSTLDEDHYPTDSSFQLRKERNEKYLSVYLLEFFKRVTEKEKVFDVKTEMETLRPPESNRNLLCLYGLKLLPDEVFRTTGASSELSVCFSAPCR